MKRLLILASLASVLWAVPVVRRTSLASLETFFERTLRGADMEILALPRGVYLEGYGAVFTADVNLTYVPTPNPFRLTIEKPEIDRIYQKKLALLPVLRDRMQQVLLEAGSTLVTVPKSRSPWWSPWVTNNGKLQVAFPLRSICKGSAQNWCRQNWARCKSQPW